MNIEVRNTAIQQMQDAAIWWAEIAWGFACLNPFPVVAGRASVRILDILEKWSKGSPEVAQRLPRDPPQNLSSAPDSVIIDEQGEDAMRRRFRKLCEEETDPKKQHTWKSIAALIEDPGATIGEATAARYARDRIVKRCGKQQKYYDA